MPIYNRDHKLHVAFTSILLKTKIMLKKVEDY